MLARQTDGVPPTHDELDSVKERGVCLVQFYAVFRSVRRMYHHLGPGMARSRGCEWGCQGKRGCCASLDMRQA